MELHFLDRCLKETLRLRPPIMTMMRMVKSPQVRSELNKYINFDHSSLYSLQAIHLHTPTESRRFHDPPRSSGMRLTHCQPNPG